MGSLLSRLLHCLHFREVRKATSEYMLQLQQRRLEVDTMTSQLALREEPYTSELYDQVVRQGHPYFAVFSEATSLEEEADYCVRHFRRLLERDERNFTNARDSRIATSEQRLHRRLHRLGLGASLSLPPGELRGEDSLEILL